MALWLLLVVLGLASYRATRLLVRDDFPPVRWLRCQVALRGHRFKEAWENDGCFATLYTDGKLDEAKHRRAVQLYNPRWEWAADLVTCPWCASGWVSLAAVGLAWLTGLATLSWAAWLLVWGATWAIAALLHQLEG